MRSRRTATFGELTDEAAASEPGSDGVLFLPYLTGERTPHPDPRARGAFVGLRVDHRRPHLTRAVLEGVAFGLRDALELVVAPDRSVPAEVRATGGGSTSRVWRRILADVLNTSIVTTSSSEGAALGAAMLAAVGSRWFPSVETACNELVDLREIVSPSDHVATYEAAYDRYRELYPALAPTFHSLPSD